MPEDEEVSRKAYLVVATVRAAMKNGSRHYNAAGDLLETEKAVLTCLVEEGTVTIDARFRREVTTTEAELTALLRN